MYLLKRKSVPLIGLDISETSIKLLELTAQGSSFRVESYAVEPLPSEAVTDRTITDVDAVGQAIKRVVAKSRTKNTNAAVAVSGSSVITKIISMPAGLSDTEMEDQLQVEADEYIPFPLEEVAMDFEVIGTSADSPDRVDVILAASRVEIVDNCVAAMEIGGLTAKVVDVESFVIDNVVALLMMDNPHQGDEKTETVAVADVGSAIMTFSVLENMKTVYSREQQFGGAQLTEEIQRRYGLSFEEAGIAKKRGGLPDNYEPEVLEPFKESMVQQIERAQQFFFSSSNVESIDRIILAGGCAAIPGVAKLVKERMGIETAVANPFAKMTFNSRVSEENLRKDASALMIAVGLALRGVI
ncbi:MAG: pilus assembly protein PilM [Candidatus Eutrophobiaceae bacterium]